MFFTFGVRCLSERANFLRLKRGRDVFLGKICRAE